MRYEWTPASEPPDSVRHVQLWITDGKHSTWADGCYAKYSLIGPWVIADEMATDEFVVTHWRDVEPPKEGE